MIRFDVQFGPARAEVRRASDRSLDAFGKDIAGTMAEVTKNTERGIKTAMRGAGLGRLSNAISSTDDVKKGRVQPLSKAGRNWRAGGAVYLRSKSPRTVGAFQAYSQGAAILPKRGRWLAFSTDEIPQRVGRYKMTPKLYEEKGYASRIGPLDFVPDPDNSKVAYLIVRSVTVNKARGFGQARRAPRGNRSYKNRQKVDYIVAFILIRATRRQRRFNPEQIHSQSAARAMAIFNRRQAKRQTVRTRSLVSYGGAGGARFI